MYIQINEIDIIQNYWNCELKEYSPSLDSVKLKTEKLKLLENTNALVNDTDIDELQISFGSRIELCGEVNLRSKVDIEFNNKTAHYSPIILKTSNITISPEFKFNIKKGLNNQFYIIEGDKKIFNQTKCEIFPKLLKNH